MFHATGPNRVLVLALFALLVLAAFVLLGTRVLPGGEDVAGSGQTQRAGAASAVMPSTLPGATA